MQVIIYKLKRFDKLFLGFNNFLKYFFLRAYIPTKWSHFTHVFVKLSNNFSRTDEIVVSSHLEAITIDFL